MKKTALACLMIAGLLSCKKDKDKDPEPTPVELPTIVSAVINGEAKKCNTSCFSSSKSGGMRSAYFYINGINESIYFSPDDFPAPGTYSLVKFGDPYLMYSKNNTYYRAVSGTIVITQIDTSANGVINKLNATFNFKTDTTAGVFFNITDGAFKLN